MRSPMACCARAKSRWGKGLSSPWDVASPGVLMLPSGRLVRGRGLGRPAPAGAVPEFGLSPLVAPPDPPEWPSRWVRWPDFRLPSDREDAREAFLEAWQRA